MNADADWHVTFVHQEALLFSLADDGTVTMRVMPVQEWDARVAEGATAEPGCCMSELARQVIKAQTSGSSAPGR